MSLKGMQTIILAGFSFFAWAALPSYVAADELRFVNEHWPPYIIATTDNEVKGIDVEILRNLAQRLNLDLTIGICPWARCLKAIEDGEALTCCQCVLSITHAKSVVS